MGNDIFEALGLDRNPFSMAADTDGYFHTDTTKQIQDEIAFGILSRKGFLLLTGEVGVGKTSLLYQLLRRLEPENLVTSWIFNTMLNKEELLHAIARDYGIEAPKTANVAQLIDLLQAFLVEQNAKDRNCAIIVDEAHNLSLPAMEALRMLSNLEVSGKKLVQILLVGQPELKERLDEQKLRQLRSRISIFKDLREFTREESGQYVNYKLASAKSQFRLGKPALKVLYMATHGNTRMINLVMERALYAAVAFGERDLTPKVLKAAVAEIATCQVEVAQRLARKGRIVRRVVSAAACALFIVGALFPSIPMEHGSVSPAGFVTAKIMALTPADDPAPVQKMDASDAVAALQAQAGDTNSMKADAPADAKAEVAPKTAAKPAPEEPRLVASIAETGGDAGKSANNTLTHSSKIETSLDKAQKGSESPKVLPGYIEFLKPIGLESLGPKFAKAVDLKQIDVIEEVLPGGVQALKLDRLPANSDIEFTAFPWKKTVGENPSWLVLWRAPFAIKDFYYGYRNEDILTLQRMLKRLGYYWGPDDGMVGPVTWRAINGFQKDMKLKRTMWPDPETVFWLNVMSKQS